MTPEEATSYIGWLSNRYGIPSPRVLIGDEYFRGMSSRVDAYYQKGTIALRPSRLTAHVIRHEFFHAFQDVHGLSDERGAEEFAECEVCGMPVAFKKTDREVACHFCGAVFISPRRFLLRERPWRVK